VQNTLLNLPGRSDGSITIIDLKHENVIIDTLRNTGYNPNSTVLLPRWNDLAGHSTRRKSPRGEHNERMEYLRSYLSHEGFIPSVALVLIFVALLRAVRNSMWRIALLSLPGTIAHELAHFVVGLLLLAKPRGFSIWPRAQGHSWRLGSVSFGNIGLLNGALVALAPLLLLPIAWLCVVHVLLPLWNDGQRGWWLLAGYLTATALFAALPSFQDIKLGGRSLLLYAVLGGLLWWAYTHA
jgi:hypothetical protein